MAENPPPEFFLAAYFRAKDWWSAPEHRAQGGADELPPMMSDEEFEAWERQFALSEQVGQDSQ